LKITVVSAHRGDAALALGLSVAEWLRQGHAVEVVSCFTRSEFAPFSDVGSVHANDRMSFASATRKREDESWAKMLRGKFTPTDLNMKDAPLRLHCGAEDVFGLAVNLAEKSAVKIRKAIERSGAEALVLPLGLDGHVDRVTARDAGAASWQATLPVAFYEGLPQAVAFGDERLKNAALAVRPDLEPALVGEPAEDAVARKRRVAWCYDSQIDEATTLQIAEFTQRYDGRERLWANAAWRAIHFPSQT
jgi:LmbE family N-acetylglucosaminyl deacetylase